MLTAPPSQWKAADPISRRPVGIFYHNGRRALSEMSDRNIAVLGYRFGGRGRIPPCRFVGSAHGQIL